jgi:transposase
VAIRWQLDTWLACRQQVASLDSPLAETFLALPEAKYLLSIPGLNIIAAATILAEIGDPSHYRKGRQLINLARPHPGPNTSGWKSRSQTPMSHKGRPGLRPVLVFAVLRLIQQDDDFAQADQHLPQRAKNRLSPMQAVGALMNKLLRLVWAVIRKRTLYQSANQSAV